MGRRAITIKKLRDLGYIVDAHDDIVFISLVKDEVTYKIHIYPYDLFKYDIFDIVERKMNNFITETLLYDKRRRLY